MSALVVAFTCLVFAWTMGPATTARGVPGSIGTLSIPASILTVVPTTNPVPTTTPPKTAPPPTTTAPHITVPAGGPSSGGSAGASAPGGFAAGGGRSTAGAVVGRVRTGSASASRTSPGPAPNAANGALAGPAPTAKPKPVLAPGIFDEPVVLAAGRWRGVSLQAATHLSVPIAFGAGVALFILLQALVDRRDPKVSRAPERGRDDTVGFT
ncbi:MAG: hypothetical protein ACRDYY_05985 [Acidimicrobiales bacterium]